MIKQTALQEVPAGTTFKVWGRQFTVLRQDEDKTFVLAAEFATTMPFREDDKEYQVAKNDFRDSSVREYLNGEYIDELVDSGANRNIDILPLEIDLKCTLGQREYGFDTVSAGLLTLEQYGEFYDIIPLIDEDWWCLATPWKTPSRSSHTYNTGSVWFVCSNGDWNYSNYDGTFGVRPALNLNPLLSVSWDCENEEGCEFCQRYDFGNAACEINEYGTCIKMAGGSYRFPKEEQFRFCPCCGRELARS